MLILLWTIFEQQLEEVPLQPFIMFFKHDFWPKSCIFWVFIWSSPCMARKAQWVRPSCKNGYDHFTWLVENKGPSSALLRTLLIFNLIFTTFKRHLNIPNETKMKCVSLTAHLCLWKLSQSLNKYHMDMKGPITSISLIYFSHKDNVLHSAVSQLYATEAATKSVSTFMVAQHFRHSHCVKAQLSNPHREH